MHPEVAATVEKPVLDEGAFEQLLAAAYVIQQQMDELRVAPRSVGDWPAAKPSYQDALTIVAETQEQLRSRGWDIDAAANLVAEVLLRITHATGVAVALERAGMLEYVSAIGSSSRFADVSLSMPPDLPGDFAGGEAAREAGVSAVRETGGDENDIALPLLCEGKIAGILEVSFARGSMIQEDEFRCCQLMAELLTEAIVRATPTPVAVPARRQTSADGERAQELLERTSPGGKPRRGERKGRKRARVNEQPVAEPAFERQNVPPVTAGTEALAVHGSHHWSLSSTLPAELLEESEAISAAPAAPPRTEVWNPWISAARARQWLEALDAQGSARRWLGLHRSDLYLGGAIVILALSIGSLVRSSQPSVPLSRNAPPALTLFEKILVALDLAEPPANPVYTGNPSTMVWVDIRTALYYCPGSELYGKTEGGKLTTQRDAQIDQFQPAERKSCN